MDVVQPDYIRSVGEQFSVLSKLEFSGLVSGLLELTE
jgi:hypothetical protein